MDKYLKVERLSLNDSCSCLKHIKVNIPGDVSKIDFIIYQILEFGFGVRQVVVFVPTTEVADMLYTALYKMEHLVETTHGSFPRPNRDIILSLFNSQVIQVLITTDRFLSPDFDQSLVNAVINWHPPRVYDSCLNEEEPDISVYLKRFCSKGAVFNFLSTDTDKMIMEKLERRLGLEVIEVPSSVTTEDFAGPLDVAGLG